MDFNLDKSSLFCYYNTMKERIENILEKNFDAITQNSKNFLNSLLSFLEANGDLTERQQHALRRIEERYSDEAISNRADWEKNYSEQHKKHAQIAASYYSSSHNVAGYFRDLALRVLEEPAWIPSEKQYRAMCENKYAKRVIESSIAEPKYPAGSFVMIRAGKGPYQLLQSRVPAMVVEADAGPVISAAKGSKLYKILPMGSSTVWTVEERDIKKCRK
jgi:hypothetical protein